MPVTIVKGAGATKWVKLRRYCQLTGDTPNAVHAKRKKGIWQDGVHCRIPKDGKLWINLEEVDKWVENTSKALL